MKETSNTICIEELRKEIEIYKKALSKSKNPFGRAIFEFEIKCVEKDIKEILEGSK